MSTNPCFVVPSPQEINNGLFANPPTQLPVFPQDWTATALLTPFGGLPTSAPLTTSDELVIATISYYRVSGGGRVLRTRLYLLESLLYYDFFFQTNTVTGQTTWSWLISDPSDPDPNPKIINSFGPFPTTAQMPKPTFLGDKQFSFVGTWNVVNQPCDGFSATAGQGQAGTWFSFLAQTSTPSRIMNVDDTNDFKIPVLGAYYLVNFITFNPNRSLDGATIERAAENNAPSGNAPSPMLTLQDIQNAMSNPPAGASQMSCTPADIAAIIPGISHPQSQPRPPAWTDQMQSICYMMGQDTYPYYCQVYYDYTVNQSQTSVFVTQGTYNQYNSRQDMVLPLGTLGPALNYEWNAANSQWNSSCYTPGGGVVPMPVPNFVQAGGGLCRAVIRDNPYFGRGQWTIWSVSLGGASDFWYWFDAQQRGVVFSLAPAGSLTMIDYQTFVQNPRFQPCIFAEPTTGLPECPDAVAEIRQKLMLIPKGGF
jgi:hypothetical protein